jgi:ornithine cyclodeaminase/alanine dehydrogenase-like protein (mu-crystallin family)
MLALNAAEIRRVVPMPRAIELMKAVFARHSQGETITPLRTPVNLPDGSGVVLFMPAFVPAGSDTPPAIGAKIVSVFGGNVQKGLPTINAVVVTVDPSTGAPLGLLEGATVTALRTGAVSGAATDLLARLDSSQLAIIGAGAQGVTQAAAVCAVRPIREIRVADLNRAAVESFAERLAVWNAPASKLVTAAADAQTAVRDADVICTATTSTRAVFEDDWLAPGAHINAVGAYTPAMQEIPDATIGRALIVVDATEAALHEAGDLIQAIQRGMIAESDVQVELGAVVLRRAAGRSTPQQITFFKSVGNAIQDMIVAGAALDAAAQAGIGQQLSPDYHTTRGQCRGLCRSCNYSGRAGR